METSEIIFVILLAGGLLIPSAIAKQWWLLSVFLVFFFCFGLIEWLAVSKTDLSVSQHFWEYSMINPIGAWFVLAGMLIGWLALLLHLSSKMRKKIKTL